ncbi:hypothetical protein EDC01DRAFT_238266 [Geopyxis carbonaria]|nr:hypothetical protein EDC01DRAFT_238266 [Geopyxis carbonaria]
MLFDDGDASLLKKWIVKRLEDISDADSDVLADYVLALLRHDQSAEEVKTLCVDQLDDFLREHTRKFVEDVFTALDTKAFLSVNSTLTGGGLSVSIPAPTPKAQSPEPMKIEPTSPTTSVSTIADAAQRGQKRQYFDRDAVGFNDDAVQGTSAGGAGRGSKSARRGVHGPGRWPNDRFRPGQSPSTATFPAAPPPLFGVPPVAGNGFPWAPPDPNDPMAQLLAAQVAATAWGAPFGAGGPPPAKKIVKKVGKRCKDYDEKGFCMKGDMCPYEHGVDHITVPGEGGTEAGLLSGKRQYEPTNSLTIDSEYDPNDSMIFPSPTAETRPRGGGGRGRGHRGGRGGGGGRGGRSDFSATGPSFDRANVKLVIENVPEDKLTEGSMKEFFSKFGNVTDVEIHQHKNFAILKFEQWEMAKAAYDSPAPIFDNRFVKVFWHRPSDASSSTSPSPMEARAKRFGSPGKSADHHHSHHYQQPPREEEMEIDIEEVKRKQEELQKAHEEKMARKKKNEEAAAALQKMKDDLMARQAEEKRKLYEKLAKKHAAAASAKSASPVTDASGAAGSPAPELSKSDSMTAALKAQLEALEAEAQALGIDANQSAAADDAFDLAGFRGRGARGRGRFATRARGAYRGRGGYDASAARGRGRGAPTMKLDNRTRRVTVTAPDLKGDREEDFRHYLINNGIEVEAIEPHPEKEDTQIFTFRDRRNAEKFVFSGNEIPSVGTVSMAWHNVPLPPQPVKPAHASAPAAAPANNEEGDTRMAEADSHHHHQSEDAYDLADDDEGRWDDRADALDVF